jgi:hypothetical protein
MTKEKCGELISLVWEDKPPAYYFKGHVPLYVAIMEVENWDDNLDCKGAIINHVWAKYVRARKDDGLPDGCTMAFRTSTVERKGWFKVTALLLVDQQKKVTP